MNRIGFDFCGTLTKQKNTTKLFIEFIYKKKIINKYRFFLLWALAKFVSCFDSSLYINIRVKSLKGLSEDVFRKSVEEFIVDELLVNDNVLSDLVEYGSRAIIISYGISDIISTFLRKHTERECLIIANSIDIENGILTGRFKQSIMKIGKRNALGLLDINQLDTYYTDDVIADSDIIEVSNNIKVV